METEKFECNELFLTIDSINENKYNFTIFDAEIKRKFEFKNYFFDEILEFRDAYKIRDLKPENVPDEMQEYKKRLIIYSGLVTPEMVEHYAPSFSNTRRDIRKKWNRKIGCNWSKYLYMNVLCLHVERCKKRDLIRETIFAARDKK